MSTFICPIVKVKLEPHPGADTLSLATIKGWSCVTKTDDFKNEEFGVYIPIDAVAPKDHPLLNFLEGKKVRTIKLRKYISQGVLLPWTKVYQYLLHTNQHIGINMETGDLSYGPPSPYFKESFRVNRLSPELDMDMSLLLNIKKWEEPIKPQRLTSGGVQYAEVARPSWLGSIYDIENWNNHSNVIMAQEPVIITEKIHGTNFCACLVDSVPYLCSRKRALRISDS
jgi:hypothetical protein